MVADETSVAGRIAACPDCGTAWERIGPEGYYCRRCDRTFGRDNLEQHQPGPAERGPEHYFPKGFSAKRVAERLREETHFAHGGGELYVYTQGVYRPAGSKYVHTRTAKLLEDRWTSRNADETVKYLLATSPPL